MEVVGHGVVLAALTDHIAAAAIVAILVVSAGRAAAGVLHLVRRARDEGVAVRLLLVCRAALLLLLGCIAVHLRGLAFIAILPGGGQNALSCR